MRLKRQELISYFGRSFLLSQLLTASLFRGKEVNNVKMGRLNLLMIQLGYLNKKVQHGGLNRLPGSFMSRLLSTNGMLMLRDWKT